MIVTHKHATKIARITAWVAATVIAYMPLVFNAVHNAA